MAVVQFTAPIRNTVMFQMILVARYVAVLEGTSFVLSQFDLVLLNLSLSVRKHKLDTVPRQRSGETLPLTDHIFKNGPRSLPVFLRNGGISSGVFWSRAPVLLGIIEVEKIICLLASTIAAVNAVSFNILERSACQ